MHELNIADDLALPVDAAAARYVILGKSGTGKTSGDAVLIEEFIGAGVPTVVLDPLGKMWGLRSSSNGDAAGLPIAILGGAHGDVPLRADRGAYVADMLADGVSAVLDLSQFTHDDQCTFVADFLPRLTKRVRVNMHVAIEEAETFAPERTSSKAHARARAASTVFGRTARNYGIGWTYSTQKAQILSKEVIDAADVFIAMKMTGELAQAAIGAEVRSRVGKALGAQIMEALPGLARGHAWFIPDDDWLGGVPGPREPTPFHFRWRRTFEVRAPKVGEERRAPRVLAPVDLKHLREVMAEDASVGEEGAEGVDTAALKREISELRRELAERPEVSGFTADDIALAEGRGAADMRSRFNVALDTMRSDLRVAHSQIAGALDLLDRLLKLEDATPVLGKIHPSPALVPSPHQVAAAPAARQSRAPATPGAPGSAMSKAERLILTAVAQRNPKPCSRPQASLLSGYSYTSSSFANALGSLRSKGYLEGSGDDLKATTAGRAALGPVQPLPTGRALVEFWIGRLGKAEGMLLDFLSRRYPRSVTKEQLSEGTGYSITSSSFANALGRLRTLELVTRGGDPCASKDLFG